MPGSEAVLRAFSNKTLQEIGEGEGFLHGGGGKAAFCLAFLSAQRESLSCGNGWFIRTYESLSQSLF